jgi:hypothetical protein
MVQKMCYVLLAVLIVCSTVQIQPACSQELPKYKAKGQIDPTQVRNVVTYLGIGEKVRVKLDSDVSFNGKIQTIDENSVTIIERKTGQSKVVAFDEIKELQKKKFPAWATVAIVSGSVVALMVAPMFAECGSGGCH